MKSEHSDDSTEADNFNLTTVAAAATVTLSIGSLLLRVLIAEDNLAPLDNTIMHRWAAVAFLLVSAPYLLDRSGTTRWVHQVTAAIAAAIAIFSGVSLSFASLFPEKAWPSILRPLFEALDYDAMAPNVAISIVLLSGAVIAYRRHAPVATLIAVLFAGFLACALGIVAAVYYLTAASATVWWPGYYPMTQVAAAGSFLMGAAVGRKAWRELRAARPEAIPAVMVMAGGIVLSACAAFAVLAAKQGVAHDAYRSLVRLRGAAIHDHVQHRAYLLIATRQLFAASRVVNRREFHGFLAPLLKNDPIVTQVSWQSHGSRGPKRTSYKFGSRDSSGVAPAAVVALRESSAIDPGLVKFRVGSINGRPVIVASIFINRRGFGESKTNRGVLSMVMDAQSLLGVVQEQDADGMMSNLTVAAERDATLSLIDVGRERTSACRGCFHIPFTTSLAGLRLQLDGVVDPMVITKEVRPIAVTVFLVGTFAFFALASGVWSISGKRAQVERLNRELEVQREVAEKASRAKSTFVANLSHEIRTPLTGVLGLTDILLESPLSNEQRQQLTTVQSCGTVLLSLVDNILDLSKIEAEKIDVQREQFSAEHIVRTVHRIFEFTARSKNVSLSIDCGESIRKCQFLGDSGRITQILVNLAGNAIKFTPSGGSVVMLVTGAPAGEGIWKVAFTVRDTGIGIPPEKLDAIFDPFEQVDSTTSRRFGGTGLGLTISRRLVSLMGGELDVHSAPNSGSTFRVSLSFPVVASEVAEPSTEIRSKRVPSGRKIRILLVEDNSVNQTLVRRMLEGAGHAVTTADDGTEALARVSDEDFDLILMDIQMPIMDGLTATRRIRDLGGRFVELPIVALSANVLEHDREACRAAGMNSFLGKPVSRAQLLQAVTEFGCDTKSADASA